MSPYYLPKNCYGFQKVKVKRSICKTCFVCATRDYTRASQFKASWPWMRRTSRITITAELALGEPGLYGFHFLFLNVFDLPSHDSKLLFEKTYPRSDKLKVGECLNVKHISPPSSRSLKKFLDGSNDCAAGAKWYNVQGKLSHPI